MLETLPPAQRLRVQALMQSGKFADELAVVDAAIDLLERGQRNLTLVQIDI